MFFSLPTFITLFFKLMWFYFDDHTGIPAASLGITERGVVGYPGVRKARLLLGLFSVGDCCVITVFVASLNWKKKQDFIDTSSPRFVTHKTMNGKSTNGTLGGMACIEGLPPLPKSLSGLLNSSGGSWREMERMYVKKTMIQDDLSRGRNNADNLLANKPANLDAALALLRKEMVTFSVVFLYLSTGKWSVYHCWFNPSDLHSQPFNQNP